MQIDPRCFLILQQGHRQPDMGIPRERLYQMPWTKHDNAGGWVEVTDECDLHCRGCYRHSLEGHRDLADIESDILLCKKLTNCDRMAVAGGEPLLYPHLLEVIAFIHAHKMKPVLLTNGERLDRKMAAELKDAGLAKFHFHIDSGQSRPGWVGKNEAEMNTLRQRYADLCWELRGIQCGYNVTITRTSLEYLPSIVDWCRQNIPKVQHMSLVAYRGFPLKDNIEYRVGGKKIDAGRFQHSSGNEEEINITTDEMFAVLEDYYGSYRASAYLNGTADPRTYKFLVSVNVGTKNGIYGTMEGDAVRLVQNVYHRFKKRYCSFIKNPKSGKKIFLFSVIDGGVREAFFRFLKDVVKNPRHIAAGVYIQSISLQQPNEFLSGKANLCNGCLNMMVYKGKLIHSCRLDEYRMFGGEVEPVETAAAEKKP